MIFDELSIAFFRFSLRALGAELEGGAVNSPPPAPACSAREAASARVNNCEFYSRFFGLTFFQTPGTLVPLILSLLTWACFYRSGFYSVFFVIRWFGIFWHFLTTDLAFSQK